MSDVGVVALLGALGAFGVLLAMSGLLQPAPTLPRIIRYLQRTGDPIDAGARSGLVPSIVARARRVPGVLPDDADLRVLGRSPESHVVYLIAAAFAGLVGPSLILGVLTRVGVIGLGWFVPVFGALAGAVIGPLLVHTVAMERIAQIRTDLRYQVSAYLDVVTMLLAGNTGYEGALEQAAHAGDGRLFGELRRRMRESGTRGSSLTDALHRTGVALGLAELEQVASTAALSAAEGAPVARTLAAKCATLRSALATEQETEARLRTSRLTTPIVGMALIFMALVIYPALSFS